MPLSERQLEYLKLMGIPVWHERKEPAELSNIDNENLSSVDSFTEPNTLLESVTADSLENEPKRIEPVSEPANPSFVPLKDVLKREELPNDWSQMIDVVSSCERCELHQSRQQTVFGQGNIEADWMIIGEAPSREEEQQGESFVGRPGELLDQILASIGLKRKEVYISNIVKCRTPKNREPKLNEAAQCRSYLEQQIAMVNPKVILCLGRIAAQYLLVTQDPLSRIRGKVHTMIHPSQVEKNISIVATYHPAYLLRSPSQKRKVWDDLKIAYSALH